MDKCNPLHIKELDRRLNLDGFEFITNACLARRGGGVTGLAWLYGQEAECKLYDWGEPP